MAHVLCPACGESFEFSGALPRFCSSCGQPLAKGQPASKGRPVSTIEYANESATAPPPSAADAETVQPAPGVVVATSPAPAGMPQTVGGYRLLRELGRGGMGSVYEAEEIASGRRVALKLISAHFTASRDAVERFRREGRLASGISHPRCVFILAADEDGGRPYIVMELMSGATLDDLIKQKGPLPPEQAIARILDVIEGLEEAHRSGVIHRDVKPNNCFLEGESRVKIGDFGLAKSLVAESQLTKTGSFLGTPLFASPEQIRAEPLDQQTDVYSVAATLYFLLTGQAPFQTGDTAATLARIVSDPAPSMCTLRPELNPGLDEAVLRGLERNRARRWLNLGQFKDAVLQFMPGRLSIGGMGIRFGAYVIDYIVLMILSTPVSLYYLGTGAFNNPGTAGPSSAGALLGFLLSFLYFGLLEGIWGGSVGKLLLNLRVRIASTGQKPGLARALLRAGIFKFFFNLGMFSWVALWMVYMPDDAQTATLMRDRALLFILLSFVPLGGWVLGVLLILSPMRKRNGYRGIHEFLSGTRVVRLPWPERRRTLLGRPVERPLAHPDGCPERLGAFVVHGALVWTETSRLLAGEDPSLGRTVWIWLRPATEPPLTPARRDANRTTRLRWLAAGLVASDEGASHEGGASSDGSWEWDAFRAPLGGPLIELVAEQDRLTWPEVRPLLEQLTDELTVACDEKTLPETLQLEQIWIQPNGGVQVFDMRPAETPRSETLPTERTRTDRHEAAAPRSPDGKSKQVAPRLAAETPEEEMIAEVANGEDLDAETIDAKARGAEEVDESADAAAQQRSLALVARVSALLLEGRPRAHPVGPPIQAPLPGHARRLLARLLDDPESFDKVKTLHKALAASHDKPAEVTRARRVAHLGVQAGFLLIGLGCCMFPAGWFLEFAPSVVLVFHIEELERGLDGLEKQAARECALASINPDPLVRLRGLAQLAADHDLAARIRAQLETQRRVSEVRSEALGWVGRQQLRQLNSAESKKTKAEQAKMIEERFALGNPFSRNYRMHARNALTQPGPLNKERAFTIGAAVALMAWPTIWIVWAFLWRGGLSYRIVQIALVRKNGRPAGRLQCAWRALLVWTPLTALLLTSLWLNALHWSSWTPGAPPGWLAALSNLAWYAGVLVLFVYMGLAVWLPTRSLHDRLSGTYLVPR